MTENKISKGSWVKYMKKQFTNQETQMASNYEKIFKLGNHPGNLN